MNKGYSARHLVSLVVAALFVCACQPSAVQTPQPDQSALQAETAPAQSGTDEIQRPSSELQWLEDRGHFSEEDHRHLSALSTRYNNIFSGLDAMPAAEVAALGFPTAKEWIEARNLSTEALKAKAEKGDTKAKAFYVDRQLQMLESLTASSGAENILEAFQASPELRDRFQQDFIDAHVTAGELLKFHPSPFSAYLFGVSSAATGGVPFHVAASIAVAGELGDKRSSGLLQAYLEKMGPMDPSAVDSSYKSMRRTAGLD